MPKEIIVPELLELLACPLCRSEVRLRGEELVCASSGCRKRFPIRGGIPVMLAGQSAHNEKQQEFFDREFKDYSGYRLDNWRLSYWRRIAGGLGIPGESNGVYLDIGAGGSGYTVIEAARLGCRAVALDLSLEGVQKAKHSAEEELGEKSRLCHFVAGIAESLPFRRQVFNRISSIAVLEHVPNDGRAIGEIARVAQRDCHLFIMVPNAFNRMSPLLRLPYLLHDRRMGHLRHYAEEDLAYKFGEYGFRVKDVIYSGHLIKLPQTLAERILPGSRRTGSLLWWGLEEADLRQSRNRSGAHLSMALTRGDGET